MFGFLILFLSLNSQVNAVIVKSCLYDIGERVLLFVQQFIIEVLLAF